jgi:hypothetical protein
MKLLVFSTLIILMGVSIAVNNAVSQDWRSKTIERTDEQHKYLKDTYEETYQESFEDVWEAVLETIKSLNCMVLRSHYSQDDEGLIIGNINTEHCTISTGRDTTAMVLKYYSYDMPNIRAARWEFGRIQYRFILREQEDGTIKLEVITQVSGNEINATKKYHFWRSNGIAENEMFTRIDKILGRELSQPAIE